MEKKLSVFYWRKFCATNCVKDKKSKVDHLNGGILNLQIIVHCHSFAMFITLKVWNVQYYNIYQITQE